MRSCSAWLDRWGHAAVACADVQKPRKSGLFQNLSGNPTQMQFDDVVLGRRSIRGYKPDPVPKALIAEIIGLAMRAPSSMNTQPWNFCVISGEPLDRIRAGNRADGGGHPAVARVSHGPGLRRQTPRPAG